MNGDFLHAINGDWDSLLTVVRENRKIALRTDASGMTVLHWVCLHHEVPTDIVVKVVFANPYAVHMRNDANHLPIDLAVQAECGERVLEVLRAAARGSHRRREDSGSERSKHHGKKDGYQATEIIDYPLPYNNHTMLHEDVRDSFEYQRHPDHSYYCESDDDIDEDEHNYKQHQDQYQSQPFQPRKGRPERTVSDQDSYSDPPQGNYGDTDMYPSYDVGATRNRGNSLSRSDPHVKSLLTEQRLRERENDLISIATVDDPIPLGLYDPSKGQPALTVMPNFQPIDEDKSNHGNGSVTSRGIGGGGARSKTAFPPRWKQSRMCHVCACGFSLVKRRHHCRNCGQSVCNQHATNRVALPKFALSEPQRVCDQCFLSGHHIMVPGGTTPSIASSYKSLPAHSQPFQTPQLNRLQFQHSR